LLVCSDFIGWERKPVLAVVTSKICQALMQKGWKIALLTLSGNALHQDFLSEDERRKEFLEAIPDVVIYATKGGFPSPLDILRYLKNRKRTISAKGVNFSLSRTKSGRSYPLFRDFVARIGKVIHPFWRGYIYCYRQMVKEGLKAIGEFKPSIIIGNHPPYCFLIASRLSELTGIPWIANIMDAIPKTPLIGFILKQLNTSRAIITPFFEKWDYRGRKVPIYKVLYGYDPSEYPYATLLPIFTITGISRIYEKQYLYLRFLRVLHRLKSEGIFEEFPLKFRLYMLDDSLVLKEWRERLGLTEIVEFYPPVLRKEMLYKECESCILFLTEYPLKFQYSTKFWEYIGTGRPILHLGDPNDAEGKMLRSLSAGFNVEKEEEIYNFLKKALKDFYTKGDIDWNPDREAISSFAFPNLAKKWDEILEKCMT